MRTMMHKVPCPGEIMWSRMGWSDCLLVHTLIAWRIQMEASMGLKPVGIPKHNGQVGTRASFLVLFIYSKVWCALPRKVNIWREPS